MAHPTRGFMAIGSSCCIALFAGCASSGTTSHAPASARSATSPGLCALQVPRSRVTARDVDGGTALDFTTRSDRVAEVRRKVRSIAAVYNHHASGSPIDGDAAAPTGLDVHPDLSLPPATASVEEIDAGARLVLRPDDPSDLSALRERARRRVGRTDDGRCEPTETSGS